MEGVRQTQAKLFCPYSKRVKVMVKNTCQCVEAKSGIETATVLTEKFPAAHHRAAQLPSILKYRGLDEEAVEAARAIKIETLMATLQAALDDLDLTVVDLLAPDGDAGTHLNTDRKITGARPCLKPRPLTPLTRE